jgi:ABC-type antimicrobial peptide transport system permease subunit
MRDIDPDTPLYWLRSMDEVIRLGGSGNLVVTQIFSAFGVLALILAGAGLYGIVAFNVGQRTREIGVRRALGAPDLRVLRSLLARNGLQVGLGLVIGLACGIPCARLLAAEMQGASSLEPGIFAAALATLAGAALLAAWLPARRALRIDPTEALRHE